MSSALKNVTAIALLIHDGSSDTGRVTDPFSNGRIQAAYDVAADDYHAAFGNDLSILPLDRRMLDQVRVAAGDGMMLDLGCGTGSVASYLTALGARVIGLDLSLGMLRVCNRVGRLSAMAQGDMRHLPLRDEGFAAVVAYYSIHHVVRAELETALLEILRVLKPDGKLLAATHLGEGETYSDHFLGHDIGTTGGTLYREQEILDRMRHSGFKLESVELRNPLGHEHQTGRIYALATKAVD